MRHLWSQPASTPPTATPWAAIPVLAALALAAWEGTIVQSSATAHWSVLAVIVTVIVTAVVAGWARQRQRSGEWVRRGACTVWRDLTGPDRRPAAVMGGTVAWVVLIAATVGWDLNSFVHQAHSLPTLSRIVGEVTRHEWGRALVFSLWVALGAYLAIGDRGQARAGAAVTDGQRP